MRTPTLNRASAALLALALFPSLAPAEAERLRGEYVHGKQVSLFTPCGAEESFWIVEEGESAAQLVRAHDELTTKAYERVWAEISAERAANDGAAGVPEEYAALLVLEAVYEVRPAGCR